MRCVDNRCRGLAERARLFSDNVVVDEDGD
jgi:hypothetical protein